MSNVHFLNPRRLRIVILDSPYDSLGTPEAQALFAKLVALKLKGYGAEYQYGVLPLDQSDFIATHFMVCQERDGELHPIMAYKSVKEPKCRQHGITFASCAHLSRCAKDDKNLLAVEKIIEEANARSSLMAYDGAWTIDPLIRKDRALVTELKNLFTCIQVNHYAQFGKFDLLLVGVLRFKTEKIFQDWGYKPLNWKGEQLQPFQSPSLREAVWLHHARAFSEQALELSARYTSYWENRIEIEKIRTEHVAAPLPLKKAA
jgi:hypothetical protein